MNLGWEEAPGLADAFAERVGRYGAVSSHLLHCSVVDPKHPRNFMGVYEVLDRFLSLSESNFSFGHRVPVTYRRFRNGRATRIES